MRYQIQKKKEISDLKKNYETNKENIESKYREEINRIQFQHTLELNELQIKLDSQISTLKIENIKLKENYNKLLESINSSNLEAKKLFPSFELSIQEKENGKINLENFKNVKKDFLEKMKRNNSNFGKEMGYKNNDNSIENVDKKVLITDDGKNNNEKVNNKNNTGKNNQINNLMRKNSKKNVPSNGIRNSKIRINVREKK